MRRIKPPALKRRTLSSFRGSMGPRTHVGWVVVRLVSLGILNNLASFIRLRILLFDPFLINQPIDDLYAHWLVLYILSDQFHFTHSAKGFKVDEINKFLLRRKIRIINCLVVALS